MAPPRRAAKPPPQPHNTKGWLSRCRRPPKNRKGSSRRAVDPLATVTDDLLFEAIFSLVFSDAGDVARCAAVCRRWGRIVAARSAAILRALPPPDRFLPHLALGFFHGGQRDLSSTRRRQPSAQAQTDPCFIPTPSASVLLGSPFPGLPEGGDAAAISGGWGPEFRKPGAQISGHELQRLGPAVVLRGVVYWPIIAAAALDVRLDGGAATAVMDVHVVPYRMRDYLPNWRLLGTTPDGMLSYVSAGVAGGELRFLVETMDVSAAAGAEWERGEAIDLTQLKVPTTTELELKMRWLGEKSGTLFFTIGEGGSTSGAFALNLATRSLDKLADGVECNSWRSLYGYEMDPAALLVSITARFN